MAPEVKHLLRMPLSERDWARGPADAPVTLVEYVDFQCPCCQGSYPVVERVVESREGAIRFAVRHFPVTSIHPNAEDAALAAEAAGRQGKFWEMYHRLFTSRNRLRPFDFDFHARQLDLDLDLFHRDMERAELREKVRQDKRYGLRSGVNGTPTLFVNGVRYDSRTCPVQEEELRAALEALSLPRAA